MRARLTFLSLLFAVLIHGCGDRCETADGPRITQRDYYDLVSELEMNMAGDCTVLLDTTKAPQMEVIAQPALLEHINRNVEEERLIITQMECVQENLPALFSLTCGPLEKIIQGSVGTIRSAELMQLQSLHLENRGLGDIDLHLDTEKLVGEIRSSGDLILGGTASRFDFLTTSSGDLRATDLICDTIHLKVIGSSVCEVYTDGLLHIQFFAPGTVNYRGNPDQLIVEGGGTVTRIGE